MKWKRKKKEGVKTKKPKLTRKQRLFKVLKMTGFIILFTLVFLYLLGGGIHAEGGLVDDTVNTTNEFSKYALDNYQLDFYVDTSWSWLPWNWVSGIGKQVMYGLFAVTNFIWTISLYISNATGYLVKEAYNLDFITQTADSIGKNIQTLAGVTKNGFSSSGFYIGFLLIFIMILGVYVTYTGLIKRETTKAIRAIMNFVIVFVISASFIAYAPDYIKKVNDFSSDISNTALNLGTKIVLPNSETKGKDSVDLIRDSLFAVQVKNPWLLLQYGTSDIEALGNDRVEELLSISPDDADEREDVVIDEIEDEDNKNLTITKTINRLGTVTFLFIFNIGISIFVFLLTGIMIFSQVLFIIYAMFMPIGFLLSMIPTYEHMGKRAIEKLFNTIMTRAGITLIITVAFSISSMLYTLSASAPFFLIAFLQIVTFAGIYFKLSDLLSMFSLQASDSQRMAGRIMRTPRAFLMHRVGRIQRTLQKSLGSKNNEQKQTNQPKNPKNPNSNGTVKRSNTDTNDTIKKSTSAKSKSQRTGEKVGQVLDTKNRIKDKAKETKDKIASMPTRARYSVSRAKQQMKNRTLQNANEFKQGITKRRTQNEQKRENQRTIRERDLVSKKDYLQTRKSHRRNST